MNAETMKFTAIRAVKLLFRQFLEIFDELKVDSENNARNLKETFVDIELFLKKEHGVSISLTPFLKHYNAIDDNKSKQIRKRILDYGNHLIREIETQG